MPASGYALSRYSTTSADSMIVAPWSISMGTCADTCARIGPQADPMGLACCTRCKLEHAECSKVSIVTH